MKTIETFLPVFTGFYNTIFEPDDSSVIESYNQENDTDLGYDNFEWDYSDYYNQVAENCCKAIEKLLKENNIVQSIEFQKVVSPKFYNYSNDSINIKINFDLGELGCFIANNKNDFDAYINKNYSSCDGFTSFHSNDGDKWLKSLINDDFEKPEHKFGAMLDFVCKMLIDHEDVQYWLYEQLQNYDYCEPNYTLIVED